MELHGVGVSVWPGKASAFPLGRTNGTEEVGIGIALIGNRQVMCRVEELDQDQEKVAHLSRRVLQIASVLRASHLPVGAEHSSLPSVENGARQIRSEPDSNK